VCYIPPQGRKLAGHESPSLLQPPAHVLGSTMCRVEPSKLEHTVHITIKISIEEIAARFCKRRRGRMWISLHYPIKACMVKAGWGFETRSVAFFPSLTSEATFHAIASKKKARRRPGEDVCAHRGSLRIQLTYLPSSIVNQNSMSAGPLLVHCNAREWNVRLLLID
jgi:hypothetical protein